MSPTLQINKEIMSKGKETKNGILPSKHFVQYNFYVNILCNHGEPVQKSFLPVYNHDEKIGFISHHDTY